MKFAMLTAPSVVFAIAPASRPIDMNDSVPHDQQRQRHPPRAVSRRPEQRRRQTDEDRHLHQGDRDRHTDAGPDDRPGRHRQQLEPTQQLRLPPPLQGRRGPEGGAHRHRPAEQAGCDELDRLQRLVLDPLGLEPVGRWRVRRRGVRRVHERLQRALGDRRLHLVGLGVVRDQVSDPSSRSPHPRHPCGPSPAPSARSVLCETSKDSSNALRRRGRHLVEQRHGADLHQVAATLPLVGEDAAEEEQEHQREDHREEHRGRDHG